MLISKEQRGFMKGRSIFDNILLAQEMAQSIKKKIRVTNIIMKLDMNKAYATMSWYGLIKLMRKFGLCEGWIDIVWSVI